MIDEYKGMLASEVIPPKVLGMLDDSIMDKRYMMPLSYDETSHLLTIVTSQFEQNFLDSQVILQIVRKNLYLQNFHSRKVLPDLTIRWHFHFL